MYVHLNQAVQIQEVEWLSHLALTEISIDIFNICCIVGTLEWKNIN